MADISVITENTAVSIGLLVTIAGGIVWLTSMFFRERSNGQEIKKLWTEIDNMKKETASLGNKFSDFGERMARIETKIDLLLSVKQE